MESTTATSTTANETITIRPAIAWKEFISGRYANIEIDGYVVNVQIVDDLSVNTVPEAEYDPESGDSYDTYPATADGVDVYYYIVKAEIAIHGITYGYDSLSGIGVTDPNDPYLTDQVWEIIDTAVDSVPDNIAAAIRRAEAAVSSAEADLSSLKDVAYRLNVKHLSDLVGTYNTAVAARDYVGAAEAARTIAAISLATGRDSMARDYAARSLVLSRNPNALMLVGLSRGYIY